MKEAFIDWNPNTRTKDRLEQAIAICNEYWNQGYRLTLRQLYYQMVSRNYIANNEKSYNQIGDIVSKARMAGMIDWSAIADHGREVAEVTAFDSVADVLRAAQHAFKLDHWKGQANHVEVWCEKDALTSVLEPICSEMHVNYLACRGYSSATAMYEASRRFRSVIRQGRKPVVVYAGDHDPSGIDMSRDCTERLSLLSREGVEVERIALNIDQVRRHNLPPNPAKTTDSRAGDYIEQFGRESWELDALDPATLDGMIRDAIESRLDRKTYDGVIEAEREQQQALDGLIDEYRNR